jgi:hypothetical protein
MKEHLLFHLINFVVMTENNRKLISKFKANIANVFPESEITISEVAGLIQSNKLEGLTNRYRQLEGTEAKDYKMYKFPYVTFAGTFNRRQDSALKEMSGYIAIDVDNIDDMQSKMAELRKDSRLCLMYITPSGYGLRLVYKIPITEKLKDNYKDWYECLTSMLNNDYNLIADSACKDISRASFICHDPDVYFNDECLELDESYLEKYMVASIQVPEVIQSIPRVNYSDLISIGEKMIESSVNGEKHIKLRNASYLLGGFISGGLVEEEEVIERLRIAISKKENVDSLQDAFRTIDNCISNGKKKPLSELSVFSDISVLSETVRNKPIVFRSAKKRLEEALNLPPVIRLVGDIITKGEHHILFADTGVGKSVLGMQIADAVSKGESVFGISNQSEPLKVCYIDFELSDIQFRSRFIDDDMSIYDFNDNLFIDTLDVTSEIDIKNQLESLVRSIEPDVLFFDNIGYLVNQTTADANVSRDVMQMLEYFKREYGLTIVTIAHTPKVPTYKVLDLNDLAGSKALSNFADSVSAIGRSSLGSDVRYWKQVKCRSGEMIYNENNVIELKLIKSQRLFLELTGYGSEYEHLSSVEEYKSDIRDEVIKLHKADYSIRSICSELNVKKYQVEKIVKEYKQSTDN